MILFIIRKREKKTAKTRVIDSYIYKRGQMYRKIKIIVLGFAFRLH